MKASRTGSQIQNFNMRHGLSEMDGMVILHSKRIVIPKALRREVLKRLQASHQGIELTQSQARSAVWWPGITSNITNLVASCVACSERLPSQRKEPMKSDLFLTCPFEETATDLFQVDRNHYLVYVDRYSGWPEVTMWRNAPTSAKVMKQLRQWFVNMGIPLRVRSDNR